MQLTNSEVKSLLTDLYCKASQDDAIDMREFSVLMEGIREAVADKNGCRSLRQLTINRQKYDTKIYRPYLIDFKDGLGQQLYKNALSKILPATNKEDAKFDCWLNEYANALVYWVGAVYIPLCQQDFGFTGTEKESQQQYNLLNQYVLDTKWVEAYPFFIKLAADERINVHTRSILETLAGQVQLYHMTNADLSIQHFEKARRLNSENHIAVRCLGEYYAKKLEMETARPFMLDAISMEPNDLYNYLVIGDSYRDEQKYHIAEQWYADAYNKNFLECDVYIRIIDLFGYNDYENTTDLSLDYWIEKATGIIKNGKYDNDLYQLLQTIGNVLSKTGKGEEGRRYLDGAIDLRPHLTGAILDKGYSFGAENDFIQAEACFRQTITNRNEKAKADGYYGLGWLYEKQELIPEAIDNYKKCMFARPAWQDQMCNIIGNLHFKLKNFTEAAEYFEAAIDTNPNESVYWDNMKDAVEKSGNKDLELLYLQKALKKFPDNAEHYNKLGIYFYNQQQFQEAVYYFDQAAAIDTETTTYLENAGMAFYHQGDYHQAAEIYEKLAEKLPYESYIFYKLADLYSLLELNKEALDAINTAIRLDGNNSYYLLLKCVLLEKAECFEDALQLYNHVLELDIEKDAVLNRIGIIHYNIGIGGKTEHFAESVTYYLQAIERNPQLPIYYQNLGLAYRHMGYFPEAEEAYLKSLEMEPENATFQNYAGLLYFEWADFEKALLHFSKAAALDADNQIFAENVKLAADLLSQKNTATASNL